MENFTMYNPTKVYFGKNVIVRLPKVLAEYKSVLLLYGQGSVKTNGIYDEITTVLAQTSTKVFEYSGIKSNPLIEDVNKAADLIRANTIECILAVGGGSVIDSAKAIAAAAPYSNDAWDLFTGKLKPEKAIPIVSVLTLAATGSEMNSYAVVQNETLQRKDSFQSNYVYPKVSFLDPSYTFSVSNEYTGYGLTDLTAHALEAYFGYGDAPLSDKFVCSIIKEAIEISKNIFDNPNDYDLRARMMYAASTALNNLTGYGRSSGDWGVHSIGHVLSLLYDVPHGASLSVVYPAWLRLHSERIPERIAQLGYNLFQTSEVEETIQHIETMFREFRSPVRIAELNLKNWNSDAVIELMQQSGVNGFVHKLEEGDYKVLVENMGMI
jgi:alcohol dehydrogenase YqhD (iron-dependent ADH family)